MILTDVIDAIAVDVNAITPALPTHSTKKYARPLHETPDMCPMLAVFTGDHEPVLLSTIASYQDEQLIKIVWYENIVTSLETGEVDQTAARNALQRSERIKERTQTWAGGIPAVAGAPQNEATLVKIRYGRTQGGVWAAEFTVRVTAWS